MRTLSRSPRRSVAVILGILALASAAVLSVRHYKEHMAEWEGDRALMAREVQESLSSLHRDLEMVNALIASSGRPNTKPVSDYLTARRNELGAVRWLGYMAQPGGHPHVLLGSASLGGFDPRRDPALADLVSHESTSSPLAAAPDTFRNEASLALILSGAGPDGVLVALVDVEDVLRDSLRQLPRQALHFELELNGAPLAQWPTALSDDEPKLSMPIAMGQVTFTLDFNEPAWTVLAQETWHVPQITLLVSVAALAAWLARRPAARQPAPPRPRAPQPADQRAVRVGRLWQLGETVATLGHDMGQPLNIIRLTAESALDALENGRADPERIRRSLRAGIDQAQRLQGMIDKLLAATRRPMAPPGPVPPAKALGRALDNVAPRVAEGNIRLQTSIDDGLPPLHGHAARLEMALTQVLLNACEALSAAALSPNAVPGRLRVACHGLSGEVVISVEDDGPGFPPALLETLDDPLPETGGKRMGIGLAITLGIVAEMGGQVEVSGTHPGTRVSIRLPVAKPGRAVLVVDDEVEAAREIADYLTARGWQAQVSEGGHAALKLFGTSRFDVVVTDLHMPRGDGWSLIAALRERAPDLPIIAVTTGKGEEAHRAVNAGAVLVLNKPVGLGDLARELDELVNDL